MHSRAPIVLTGNKADLKPENQSLEAFEEMMRPIVKEWKQVEVVFEVTSKSPKLISNLFYYAQRVVLCPVSPLFDESERELTPQFRRALKYIFRKADVDRDFVLNDQEMLALNNSVFQNEQLDSSSLESLKLMIRDQCEDGVTEHGITYKGFLHLNQMIILRQKVATCWTMLKYYGFDDKLELSTSIELDPNLEYVLSLSAEAYLTSLYYQHSHNDCLRYDEVREICSTLASPPWNSAHASESAWASYNKLVEVTDQNGLDLSSWQALWHSLMLDFPFVVLKSLLYLGYPQNLKRAVEVLQKKDLLQKSSRKVMCVNVVGASGVGKSSLIDSFIRKPFQTTHIVTTTPRYTAGFEDNRILVLKEFPEADGKLAEQGRCDLVLMLTDNTDQAEAYLRDLAFSETTPKMMVQTKLDDVPKLTCNFISVLKKRPDVLFTQVVAKAVSPWTALSDEGLRMISNKGSEGSSFKLIGLITLSIVVGAFVWIRYLRPR
mmetsp:Transcript_25465/g.44302  ORF Transcript_25465/g.44302 Transcript_25465/m.44302 type:complete len:491 (+) Transcript_25465:517-1989(+)